MLRCLPRAVGLTPSRFYSKTRIPPPPPQQQSQSQQSQDANPAQPAKPDLGLPAPGEGITLDVSSPDGASAKLSSLGPLVVNPDGTTGLVANWAGMTEHERRTTLTLLGRRNKARLEALRERQRSEQGDKQGNDPAQTQSGKE